MMALRDCEHCGGTGLIGTGTPSGEGGEDFDRCPVCGGAGSVLPCGHPTEWMCATCVTADEARLRRRVATLERRLARVLRLVQGVGIYMEWTEFNGGGTVYSHGRLHGGRRGKGRGRVWSRKHARGAPDAP